VKVIYAVSMISVVEINRNEALYRVERGHVENILYSVPIFIIIIIIKGIYIAQVRKGHKCLILHMHRSHKEQPTFHVPQYENISASPVVLCSKTVSSKLG